MSFKKIALGLAVASGLTACTETTTLQVPAGLSPSQAFDTIVFHRAIATVVSQNCTRKGVTLREPNWKTGLRRDLNGLAANGYSLEEMLRYDTQARKRSLITKAVRHLEQRGVKRGQVATLCKFGRDEIAKESTIGHLLKNT